VQLQNLNWTEDKSTIFCPNAAMKKHQRISTVHWRESEKEKRIRVDSYLGPNPHQNNKFGVITEISVYPFLSMRLPFFWHKGYEFCLTRMDCNLWCDDTTNVRQDWKKRTWMSKSISLLSLIEELQPQKELRSKDISKTWKTPWRSICIQSSQ
jgi:hypothetical protein